ncbi:MAG: hypothetical protein ACXVZ4_15360, partial [Gaiellaceae bacterium]
DQRSASRHDDRVRAAIEAVERIDVLSLQTQAGVRGYLIAPTPSASTTGSSTCSRSARSR